MTNYKFKYACIASLFALPINPSISSQPTRPATTPSAPASASDQKAFLDFQASGCPGRKLTLSWGQFGIKGADLRSQRIKDSKGQEWHIAALKYSFNSEKALGNQKDPRIVFATDSKASNLDVPKSRTNPVATLGEALSDEDTNEGVAMVMPIAIGITAFASAVMPLFGKFSNDPIYDGKKTIGGQDVCFYHFSSHYRYGGKPGAENRHQIAWIKEPYELSPQTINSLSNKGNWPPIVTTAERRK